MNLQSVAAVNTHPLVILRPPYTWFKVGHLQSVESFSTELRMESVASDAADCCRERCSDARLRSPASEPSEGLGGIAGRASCDIEIAAR